VLKNLSLTIGVSGADDWFHQPGRLPGLLELRYKYRSNQ
jgi:hypothetical protein